MTIFAEQLTDELTEVISKAKVNFLEIIGILEVIKINIIKEASQQTEEQK